MTAVLAQISDLHLRTGPDDRGSAAAAAAAVAAVMELRPLPDALLVSGDLTDDGTPEQYARVRELLAPLPIPVHVLAGNHDERAALEATLGAPTAWAVRAGALRVIGCHTPIAGRPEGRLDLPWLEARLAEEPDTPTVVAMHHPPLPIGLPYVDDIGLAEEDRRGLAQVLERSPQARVVAGGHVHRATVGRLAGRPVVTCASTNLAARFELGAPLLTMVSEAPTFLVHVLLDGEVLTHLQPVT